MLIVKFSRREILAKMEGIDLRWTPGKGAEIIVHLTRRDAFGACFGEAWGEPGLLGRLDVDVGATLVLGELELRLTKVLQYKPDQNIGFVNLAPGLMISLEDVPASGVVKPGSRVTYHQMYAGDEETLAEFRQSVAPRLGKDASLRGREDAGEQINAAIDRAERFLTLASLVTVILAAER